MNREGKVMIGMACVIQRFLASSRSQNPTLLQVKHLEIVWSHFSWGQLSSSPYPAGTTPGRSLQHSTLRCCMTSLIVESFQFSLLFLNRIMFEANASKCNTGNSICSRQRHRVSILSLLCDDGLQTPVEEGREINCLWLVGDIHSYVLCVSAHN